MCVCVCVFLCVYTCMYIYTYVYVYIQYVYHERRSSPNRAKAQPLHLPLKCCLLFPQLLQELLSQEDGPARILRQCLQEGGPLAISRVIRTLNWVIRIINEVLTLLAIAVPRPSRPRRKEKPSILQNMPQQIEAMLLV